MKTNALIFGLSLLLIIGTAQAQTLSPTQLVYRNGLQQLEDGEHSAASESFYAAIRLDPSPGVDPQEYLPYVNLSVSLHKMGNTRAARDALIQSQVFGVAAKTETGQQILDRYAAEIMSATLDDSKFVIQEPASEPVSSPPAMTAGSSTQTRAAMHVAYDEEEILTDDDGTVRRCASSISRGDDKLPWFFYYQCGVELMRAGEAQIAIDAFELGAGALEESRRGKRMYGMWFIDYLPYYQIALAHSQLGNWESANVAIETSENHGEFSPTDPDFDNFSALDQLIKSNLKKNDS